MMKILIDWGSRILAALYLLVAVAGAGPALLFYFIVKRGNS